MTDRFETPADTAALDAICPERIALCPYVIHVKRRFVSGNLAGHTVEESFRTDDPSIYLPHIARQMTTEIFAGSGRSLVDAFRVTRTQGSSGSDLAGIETDGADARRLGYPITANPYRGWHGLDHRGVMQHHMTDTEEQRRRAWCAGWHTYHPDQAATA